MQEDLRLPVARNDARSIAHLVLVQMRAHFGKPGAGKRDVIHKTRVANLAFR
jgi:hypothetical protein